MVKNHILSQETLNTNQFEFVECPEVDSVCSMSIFWILSKFSEELAKTRPGPARPALHTKRFPGHEIHHNLQLRVFYSQRWMNILVSNFLQKFKHNCLYRIKYCPGTVLDQRSQNFGSFCRTDDFQTREIHDPAEPCNSEGLHRILAMWTLFYSIETIVFELLQKK